MKRDRASEIQRKSASVSDRDEWNAVLAQLRADGFTPAESIKITRAVLHVPLAEAKAIVHGSAPWEDRREGFEAIHDAVASAASELS